MISRIATSSFRLSRMCSHLAATQTSLPCREIRIPVPWGHIAAKEWGNQNGPPVLGLHGWQDNAGSFDALIPLLSPDLHIVAVDLPGHGLSSHKPRGALYNAYDWIVDVQRVIRHLQWKQFSILGHSMGAGIAFGYASSFPDNVLKLVSIDSIMPVIYSVRSLPKRIAKGIKEIYQTEERMGKPPRPISVPDAIDLLVDAMNGSVTEHSAHILLRRAATVVPGSSGVIFNRDPMLKVSSIPGISQEQFFSIIRRIKCNVLIITASDGLPYKLMPKDAIEESLKIYSNSAKSFKLVKVDGTHHVHLNNPERVAPLINEFFKG